MGLYLIAVTWNWHLLLVILEVAFGLGMVIFVHELGHFLVAKACGVKCEKFYLGFDIYGLKLARFRWGETEYGIGILPLGGYVKMLGQDDNPARAAEERERAQLHAGGGDLPSEPTLAADGSTIVYDPRSYMAKSVPQRMAIISAGVIMNVIFAFLMAMAAYAIGHRDLTCAISSIMPGEAAWKANLQPGDTLVQIGDSGNLPLRYRDLMNAVMLCNIDKGVDFQIKREGVEEPFWVHIQPDPLYQRMRPTIGVQPGRTRRLSDYKATISGTPAGETDAFKPSDDVVAVNGEPIASYRDLLTQLTRHAGETLRFNVERSPELAKGGESKSAEQVSPEQLSIEVAPRPMRTLGLVMKMGKITAVQSKSPAAENDLRAGDTIVSIDGVPPGDPLRLPERLRRRAGQTIALVVSREGTAGQTENVEKQITLRDPAWPEESYAPGSPLSVPALGVTYKVSSMVDQTEPGSPAAEAELLENGKPAGKPRFAAGDEIVKAELELPKKDKDHTATQDEVDEAEVLADRTKPLEFGAEAANWPYFSSSLQWLPPGTKVTLTLKDGRTATLAPVDAEDWFFADRGLNNGVEITTTKADSLAEAAALGRRETVDAVLNVYLFLRKMGTQISPLALGGPKAIAEAAGSAAYEGVSQLLIFLTLLSANLAVVNFLPIPLLDGGHMVFLILEGVMRRPVSEKVVVAFHYLGFIFIISLMMFVLGLDFGLIPRPH